MSLYSNFTIEEANNIGLKLKVKCKSNYSYEDVLTIGEIYEIEITPKILPMSPLCKGIGKNNKTFECHLERFEKI